MAAISGSCPGNGPGPSLKGFSDFGFLQQVAGCGHEFVGSLDGLGLFAHEHFVNLHDELRNGAQPAELFVTEDETQIFPLIGDTAIDSFVVVLLCTPSKFWWDLSSIGRSSRSL